MCLHVPGAPACACLCLGCLSVPGIFLCLPVPVVPACTCLFLGRLPVPACACGACLCLLVPRVPVCAWGACLCLSLCLGSLPEPGVWHEYDVRHSETSQSSHVQHQRDRDPLCSTRDDVGQGQGYG